MLRIGVLASHEGTTLQSIIDGCAQGRIKGRVTLHVPGKEDDVRARSLERATDRRIEPDPPLLLITAAVVRQERIRVLPGDTVESLKARVQACEREVVVNTLAAVASGELVLGRAS
jgi:folate-dependent phosphoribosylglycinamide formyltransferase PurN